MSAFHARAPPPRFDTIVARACPALAPPRRLKSPSVQNRFHKHPRLTRQTDLERIAAGIFNRGQDGMLVDFSHFCLTQLSFFGRVTREILGRNACEMRLSSYAWGIIKLQERLTGHRRPDGLVWGALGRSKMASRCRRGASDGFTLIELLVVIAIIETVATLPGVRGSTRDESTRFFGQETSLL